MYTPISSDIYLGRHSMALNSHGGSPEAAGAPLTDENAVTETLLLNRIYSRSLGYRKLGTQAPVSISTLVVHNSQGRGFPPTAGPQPRRLRSRQEWAYQALHDEVTALAGQLGEGGKVVRVTRPSSQHQLKRTGKHSLWVRRLSNMGWDIDSMQPLVNCRMYLLVLCACTSTRAPSAQKKPVLSVRVVGSVCLEEDHELCLVSGWRCR
ncbi:hypothetical protein V8C43DRAFT_227110 [Trichoderma afarasin]